MVEASAAASRAQEGRVGEAALDTPRIELKKKVKAASVRKWQKELETSGMNAGQRSVVDRVVARVLEQEFGQRASRGSKKASASEQEPLLWVMHGGPGTGKTYVIDKIHKELFEGQMGWTHGIDFQIAAL